MISAAPSGTAQSGHAARLSGRAGPAAWLGLWHVWPRCTDAVRKTSLISVPIMDVSPILRLENERKSSWMMHEDELCSFNPSHVAVIDLNVLIKIPIFGKNKVKSD